MEQLFVVFVFMRISIMSFLPKEKIKKRDILIYNIVLVIILISLYFVQGIDAFLIIPYIEEFNESLLAVRVFVVMLLAISLMKLIKNDKNTFLVLLIVSTTLFLPNDIKRIFHTHTSTFNFVILTVSIHLLTKKFIKTKEFKMFVIIFSAIYLLSGIVYPIFDYYRVYYLSYMYFDNVKYTLLFYYMPLISCWMIFIIWRGLRGKIKERKILNNFLVFFTFVFMVVTAAPIIWIGIESENAYLDDYTDVYYENSISLSQRYSEIYVGIKDDKIIIFIEAYFNDNIDFDLDCIEGVECSLEVLKTPEGVVYFEFNEDVESVFFIIHDQASFAKYDYITRDELMDILDEFD